MDPRRNPYAPGAHTPPPELAGRDELIERAAALLKAQRKAGELFETIERELIRPGITEHALSREIHALAAERFGVRSHWHKRVVRAGENTLRPYSAAPPDLVIRDDDILFVDLGPVFEAWEADFGRTYVLGDDPVKCRLRDSLAPAFDAAKAHFAANPAITGAELYDFACGLAARAGWQFGGEIAGHLVGEFPHERMTGGRVMQNIMPGNHAPIESLDSRGRRRHWILEIHFVDRDRRIGGFYEELLTVG
jgi:Xaa-Pro aminopeptidase